FVDKRRGKDVYYEDRACAIRVEQGGILVHDRQVLVDQESLVNNVDFKIPRAQTAISELELVRRSDNRRISFRLEILAKQLKLVLRGHPLQIDDGDLRRAVRLSSEKLFVAIDQQPEHQRTAFESADLV